MHVTKIINIPTTCFNIHFSSEYQERQCRGVCVVMDGSSISQCVSPPCPEQIDGREDHVPFAHTALALRCPLISVLCDGEPDQWVYFGKRVGGLSVHHTRIVLSDAGLRTSPS